MGRIIAIGSHQGGGGKTVTTLNLGVALAQGGHRVLLIDGDPAGGLSAAVGLCAKGHTGLVGLLRDRVSREAALRSAVGLDLSIIGCGAMEPGDVFFLLKKARRGVLGAYVETLARDYDYVLIDTASSYEPITTVLLAFAGEVIMPLRGRAITIRTMPLFLKVLKRIRDSLNRDLRLLGLLVNGFDPSNPHEFDLLARMRGAFPGVAFFSTVIPRRTRFERAAQQATAISLLSGDDELRNAYATLAMEVMAREIATSPEGTVHEQADRLFGIR